MQINFNISAYMHIFVIGNYLIKQHIVNSHYDARKCSIFGTVQRCKHFCK